MTPRGSGQLLLCPVLSEFIIMEKNFDSKKIEMLKKAYEGSGYIKKVWKTDEEMTCTWQEYGKYVNPIYANISGNPEIVAKSTKKGGFFLKVEIPLKDGSVAEYDLSYVKENIEEFMEGDHIILDTLLFKTEYSVDGKHNYVTGEILDED